MWQCKDCGKQFLKGEEGDNEKYCLRCQEEDAITSLEYQNYYDEYADYIKDLDNKEDDVWPTTPLTTKK